MKARRLRRLLVVAEQRGKIKSCFVVFLDWPKGVCLVCFPLNEDVPAVNIIWGDEIECFCQNELYFVLPLIALYYFFEKFGFIEQVVGVVGGG